MKSLSGKPEGFILFIVITNQKGPLHRWVPHMAKRLNSSAHAGVLASAGSSCPSPMRVVLSGTLLWGQKELPFSFLIDSGADYSFLDEGLARQAGLPLKALSEAKVVLDLSGRVLARVTPVIIAKVSNCV